MKKMLLMFMVLASVAMAGDAKMKALLTGTWTDPCNHISTVFQSDGKFLWDVNYTDHPEKWDIEDGQLIEIRGGGKSDYSYTILFLTKHEFLALVNRGDGQNYIFFKR
jgi:hypothetical protein